MSDFISEEMAQVAAHWWAGKLRGDMGRHRTDGSDDAVALAGLLVDMMQEKPAEDALAKFEDALAKRIIDYSSQGEPRYLWASFGCDYGPDQILSESAKEAGISPKNFPWKTFMRIDPDKGTVSVYDGYQSPWIQIWPKN